ncbi:unnamed protein product [Closterium sp. Naga37s-1]|nr:unnamed protein product [Closterium sp. Naga37s-1]
MEAAKGYAAAAYMIVHLGVRAVSAILTEEEQACLKRMSHDDFITILKFPGAWKQWQRWEELMPRWRAHYENLARKHGEMDTVRIGRKKRKGKEQALAPVGKFTAAAAMNGLQTPMFALDPGMHVEQGMVGEAVGVGGVGVVGGVGGLGGVGGGEVGGVGGMGAVGEQGVLENGYAGGEGEEETGSSIEGGQASRKRARGREVLGYNQHVVTTLGVAKDVSMFCHVKDPLFPFACSHVCVQAVLGYNQQAVTTLGVAKDVGDNMGLLAGLLADMVPPWLVIAVGTLLGFVGYGGLWLVLSQRIAAPPFWQVWCLLCCATNGSIYFITASLVSSQLNLPFPLSTYHTQPHCTTLHRTAPLPDLQVWCLLCCATNGSIYFITAGLVSSQLNFPHSGGVVAGIVVGFIGLSGAIFAQVLLGGQGDGRYGLGGRFMGEGKGEDAGIYSALLAPNPPAFLLLACIGPAAVGILSLFIVRLFPPRMSSSSPPHPPSPLLPPPLFPLLLPSPPMSFKQQGQQSMKCLFSPQFIRQTMTLALLIYFENLLSFLLACHLPPHMSLSLPVPLAPRTPKVAAEEAPCKPKEAAEESAGFKERRLQRAQASKSAGFKERRLQRAQASKSAGFKERRLQRAQASKSAGFKERRLQRAQASKSAGFKECRLQRAQASKSAGFKERRLRPHSAPPHAARRLKPHSRSFFPTPSIPPNPAFPHLTHASRTEPFIGSVFPDPPAPRTPKAAAEETADFSLILRLCMLLAAFLPHRHSFFLTPSPSPFSRFFPVPPAARTPKVAAEESAGFSLILRLCMLLAAFLLLVITSQAFTTFSPHTTTAITITMLLLLLAPASVLLPSRSPSTSSATPSSSPSSLTHPHAQGSSDLSQPLLQSSSATSAAGGAPGSASPGASVLPPIREGETLHAASTLPPSSPPTTHPPALSLSPHQSAFSPLGNSRTSPKPTSPEYTSPYLSPPPPSSGHACTAAQNISSSPAAGGARGGGRGLRGAGAISFVSPNSQKSLSSLMEDGDVVGAASVGGGEGEGGDDDWSYYFGEEETSVHGKNQSRVTGITSPKGGYSRGGGDEDEDECGEEEEEEDGEEGEEEGDGAGDEATEPAHAGGAAAARGEVYLGEDHSFGQALSTLDFWLLYGGLVCGFGAGLTAITNLAQIGEAQGYGNAQVLTSLVSIWQFLGRLASGSLSEHFVRAHGMPRPMALAAIQLLMAVGHLAFALAPPGGVYLGSLLIGFTYGGLCSVMPVIAAELFGRRCLGLLYNSLLAAAPLGSYLFSGVLAGYLYEIEARKDRGFTAGVEGAASLLAPGQEWALEPVLGVGHVAGASADFTGARKMLGLMLPSATSTAAVATAAATAGTEPIGQGWLGTSWFGQGMGGWFSDAVGSAAGGGGGEGPKACHGAHCFRLIFLILTAVCVLGAAVNLLVASRTARVYGLMRHTEAVGADETDEAVGKDDEK